MPIGNKKGTVLEQESPPFLAVLLSLRSYPCLTFRARDVSGGRLLLDRPAARVCQEADDGGGAGVVGALGCSTDGREVAVCDELGSVLIFDAAVPRGAAGLSGAAELSLRVANTLRRPSSLSAAEKKMVSANLLKIFKSVDTDGSGEIDGSEFYQMCMVTTRACRCMQAWCGSN